jgi:predicted kinase
MLIAFGGLPGTGKTTLARDLARRLPATYLRIDTIEQAIIAADISPDAVGGTGYFVAYALAADNLRLGAIVVADSVNPLTVTRDAWRGVAQRAGVPLIEVEVICSDRAEHRRRVEMRKADIPGHRVPSWQEVLDRPYDAWDREHVVIDTGALSAVQAVDDLIKRLPRPPFAARAEHGSW